MRQATTGRLAFVALLLAAGPARGDDGRCATYAIEIDSQAPIDGDLLREELEKLGLRTETDPDLRLRVFVDDDPEEDDTHRPIIYHGRVCASVTYTAWDTTSALTLLPKFCVNHGGRTYSRQDAHAHGLKLWRAQEAAKFRTPLVQKLAAVLQRRTAGLTIDTNPRGAQFTLVRPVSRDALTTPQVFRCMEPGTAVSGTVTLFGFTTNVQGKAGPRLPVVSFNLPPAPAPPAGSPSVQRPPLSCLDDPACTRRWLWGGGAGAALLAGAGVVWRRRRTSLAPAAIDPRPMADPGPRPAAFIFISYSRQDQASAEELHRALSEAKLPAWFDKQQLTAGDRWEKEIEISLDRCALFVPLLSAHSLGRDEGFFVTEWRAALRRMGRMKNRAFLVPVIVDDLSTERIKDDELARDFLDAAQLVRAPGGRPSAVDLQAIARLLAERRG